MAHDYPTTIQFDDQGQTIEFVDGLTLYVPAGAIEENFFEATIDKGEALTIDDKDPVTSSRILRDFEDAETGEELEDVPPEAEKAIVAVVPTPVLDTTEEVDLTLYTAPEEGPNPDGWTPDEGAQIDPVASGELMVDLEQVSSFQINEG